ncbi:hypothetical protein [Streptomyces sp. NPDC019890]|uniref:hypothetical protein n=1 Tax=Streptomyces sp. NPDC019890 TaxID=3365064 RepID=UPI00384E11CB
MDAARIALVAVLVGFVVVRRLRGEAVVAKRMSTVPLALTAVGAADLRRASEALSATDVGMLVLMCAVALLLGAARATTIELSGRDGRLWQRYRWSTLAIWAALVAARVGLGLAAHAAGADAVTGTSSLLLTLGLTLGAEAVVVTRRAAVAGLPPATAAPGR